MDFTKTKYAKMDEMVTAQNMKYDGYRQTSRAFRIVARVDMPVKEMIQFFIDENFGNASNGIPSLPIKNQKDQYRRVYSKDKIENVPEEIMRQLR